MKVLIISDIHGNLPALEYVLQKHKDAEQIICLGDVVNYGPWSNECVDIMDTLPAVTTILGNHEEVFINGEYTGKNIIAQTFFSFCYPSFSRNAKISNYLLKYSQSNCDFMHTIGNDYIYPDSQPVIEKDTFIGHSHRLFMNNLNGYRLVNAGSVGQNRTNIDEVNYVLWDPEINKVELMRDFFSADVLIKEMKNRKYPEICLDYILSKRIK